MNWFPIGHAYGNQVKPAFNWTFFVSVLHHAVLPASTMIFVSLGGWMLSMRNTMISTLGADYITFANAKGISRLIMLRYAARNAILPNLTGFGMASWFCAKWRTFNRDNFLLSWARFFTFTGC